MMRIVEQRQTPYSQENSHIWFRVVSIGQFDHVNSVTTTGKKGGGGPQELSHLGSI